MIFTKHCLGTTIIMSRALDLRTDMKASPMKIPTNILKVTLRFMRENRPGCMAKWSSKHTPAVLFNKWVGNNKVAAVAADVVVVESVFIGHDRSSRIESVASHKNDDEDQGLLLVVTFERATDTEATEGKEWVSRLIVLCTKKMQTISTATITYVVPLWYRRTVLLRYSVL